MTKSCQGSNWKRLVEKMEFCAVHDSGLQMERRRGREIWSRMVGREDPHGTGVEDASRRKNGDGVGPLGGLGKNGLEDSKRLGNKGSVQRNKTLFV